MSSLALQAHLNRVGKISMTFSHSSLAIAFIVVVISVFKSYFGGLGIDLVLKIFPEKFSGV